MTDLRDALRALRATPIVSAVAILSLALGIGANTAIFSLVNALMLRSLPVREPQQLVQVLTGPTRTSFSNPLWEQLRERDRQLFDGAFAYTAQRYNLARGGEAQLVNGVMASGGFFDVLGVPAILGRTFTRDNDIRRGSGTENRQVAVISYGFWQRQYGGAADVIGKPIELDRIPFTVIGVTGPEFTGVDRGWSYDVAIPLAAEVLMRGSEKESAMDRPTWWWMRVLARLKPADSIERATAALRGVQPQMRQATLPVKEYRPQDLPNYLKDPFNLREAAGGTNTLGRQYRDPLYLIMAVVALVLLIACANVANLLLARANARRHELSVRIALGASRWRVARQLLAESALLSLCGTVLGLLFARWGARLLVLELSGPATAGALDVGLDWRVLAFTIGLATATTFLFGSVPAMRSTRVSPSDAIKEQGRSIVGESRFGFGSVLVVAQVALSLVLVVGAGLFMRTFSSLASVRLGFEPDPILLVSANAKRSAIDAAQRNELFERLRLAAESVPGVRSAATHNITPLTNSSWDTLIENPAGLSLPESERSVHMNEVSRGYFSTYGTPLLAGRDFNEHDGPTSPRVVIVNETFAKKYFNGANPIGRWVRNDPSPGENPPRLEIVGLTRDAVYESLRDAIPPTMYTHAAQEEKPGQSVTIAVRAANGSPALLTRSLADALSRVDPDVTLTFKPYHDTVRAATVQERVIAMLSAFFGGLALLLAALGLYGVMSYAVSRRRTEIGIRMALGAGPAGAIRLILLRVAALVGLGIAAGTVLALWAAKFMAGSSLIYGLQPRDPMTLATAALVLTAIGAAAGYLPARRASRIDPARVLREG
jgi:putative ABC transport system permease protein